MPGHFFGTLIPAASNQQQSHPASARLRYFHPTYRHSPMTRASFPPSRAIVVFRCLVRLGLSLALLVFTLLLLLSLYLSCYARWVNATQETRPEIGNRNSPPRPPGTRRSGPGRSFRSLGCVSDGCLSAVASWFLAPDWRRPVAPAGLGTAFSGACRSSVSGGRTPWSLAVSVLYAPFNARAACVVPGPLRLLPPDPMMSRPEPVTAPLSGTCPFTRRFPPPCLVRSRADGAVRRI